MPRDAVLYEALLWEPSAGFFLLDRHLDRLAVSARYFNYPVDIGATRAQLLDYAADLGDRPRKVRLEASAEGLGRWTASPSTRPRAAPRTGPGTW